jgi:polyisoprenoid-binding protein YceI
MDTTLTNKWAIDPAHSEIHFKVKHLVISTVSGSFDKFEGELLNSKDDFSDAVITFSADVDSVNTNQLDRDGHLKSADFFDAQNHPKLTFKSSSLAKKSDSGYVLKGDITIRGTSKPIELAVEYGGTVQDPWGNTKAGFEITGKLNRKDFGLNWSAVTEAGGIVVADEIKLQLNIELVLVK